MRLAVVRDLRGALRVAPVLDALLGLEVELDPEALVLRIDERVGMRTEAVDMAIGLRQAAVRHQDRHLMQAFRRKRPEVPHRQRRAHVGARMTLLRVDEVGEFQRVAQEEHRRIVADDVPVAFVGIEAKRKATHVALGVRRTAFARDSREAQEGLGLLSDLREYARARIFGDVLRDRERAVSAGAFGVHGALGNALAVLMREFFEQVEILHQQRAARACGKRILVVGDGRAARGRHDGFIGHACFLLFLGSIQNDRHGP